MGNDALAEPMVHDGGEVMNQTDRWIKVVAIAMRRLTPERFQTWLLLVGGGYDEERAVKGEKFLEMMQPTVNGYWLERLKESDHESSR
jgi:hypothetical protein